MKYMTIEDKYQRALAAEQDLLAVEAMVYAIAQATRPGEPFCTGCIWEHILKPLTVPLLGEGRGEAPRQRDDGWDDGTFALPTPMNLSDLPEPDEPQSETEAWLRTREAFDAVTDKWLSDLDAVADAIGVAEGHGIPGRDDRPSVIEHRSVAHG